MASYRKVCKRSERKNYLYPVRGFVSNRTSTASNTPCEFSNRIYEAKSYVLFVKLRRSIKIAVGRLGEIDFCKGTYLYVGSAKKGIIPRLKRHLVKKKKLFWHIDYLLNSSYAYVDKIWVAAKDRECYTAGSLYRQGYEFIRDFGSSDCSCYSHLFFICKEARKIRRLLIKEGFYNADKSSFR